MSNRREVRLSAELEGGFLTFYATVDTIRGLFAGQSNSSIEDAIRKALIVADAADEDASDGE